LSSVLSHSSVSLIRKDGPFIFKICDLWVRRSVNAVDNTGSCNISCHFINGRLLVIIVDFLPPLKESWVNTNLAPYLSNELYSSSSIITKSYVSSCSSNDRSVPSERHSLG